MYINKLILKAFGKFHNEGIELRPGINLIYGPNEAGKTTVKEFILGMLYGIDKSRGLGARLDNYQLRKPLAGGGYEGICSIVKNGEGYIVERNFDRSDKSTILYNDSTGREITLGEDGLVGTMFNVEKNRYLDTLCIGQQGADTSKDLAAGINNYMINMSSAQTTDVDYSSVLNYLKQEKKKYNTKSLDQQLDRLSEEVDRRKKCEIALTNVNYRLYKLEEEYNKKDIDLDDEDEDLERLEEETNKSINDNVFFIVGVTIVALVLAILLVVFLDFGTLNKIILIAAIGVLVLFNLIRCLIIRNRLRERQLEKSIMLKQEKAKQKMDAKEFAQRYGKDLAALKTEEAQILADKKLIEEHIASYQEVSAKRDKCITEIKAIDLAMNTIKELSEGIYDDFGKALNDNVSSIVRHMTNGRYTEVKVDDQLHITVRKGDTLVAIEYLSKGTMEQIYLAVRLAAAKLLGTDTMPIIIDDIFGAYDESRLQRTLEYLETFDTEQIILFTADAHIGEMLDHLNRDYNYINLSAE